MFQININLLFFIVLVSLDNNSKSFNHFNVYDNTSFNIQILGIIYNGKQKIDLMVKIF